MTISKSVQTEEAVQVKGLPPGHYLIKITHEGKVIVLNRKQAPCVAADTQISHAFGELMLCRELGLTESRAKRLAANINDMFASRESYEGCTIADFCAKFTARDLKHQAKFKPQEILEFSQFLFRCGYILPERTLF